MTYDKIRKQLTEKEEGFTREVLNDLDKYNDKINSMIIASCGHNSPQILKMTMLKRACDRYFNGILENKSFTKERIKEADDIMKKMEDELGEQKAYTNPREAEKEISERKRIKDV